MNSSRPYLLRAIYEWLVDNELTPYILVDATAPEVSVPERYVEEGKIILNIEMQAVGNLQLGNDAVEFDARFSGVAHHIYIPMLAVKAIYAFENGRGMVFNEDESGGHPSPPQSPPPPPPPPSAGKDVFAKKNPRGRPNLKVVK